MSNKKPVPNRVSINLTDQQWKEIKLLAEREDRSTAAVIRLAIDRYLKGCGNK